MKEYEIFIEETCCKKFIVKARDEEQAFEIAEDKYNKGEFVLEPGEITNKCMMIRNEENEQETNWIEF